MDGWEIRANIKRDLFDENYYIEIYGHNKYTFSNTDAEKVFNIGFLDKILHVSLDDKIKSAIARIKFKIYVTDKSSGFKHNKYSALETALDSAKDSGAFDL